MKRYLALAGGGLLLAVLLVFLAPWAPGRPARAGDTPRLPGAAYRSPGNASSPAYQLLTNHGLELYDPPYGQYEGADCQVASGWQRFWYDGPEPHWIDCQVFAESPLGGGWVEAIEGDTSQMIVATEPYTAGLWQRVGGLTPGVGYGFHAALLTIFQTSAQPPVPGTMIKEVGLDPTGGTDPRAPQVVWSEPNDQDHGWDVKRVTAAFSEAPTMTVFVRFTSPYPSGGLPLLNLSFVDSAILAQTAEVAAVSPAVSEGESFEVRWDNAVPSPQGEIRWYDVQWLDEVEGVWHDWRVRTDELAAPFEGQWGHRYRFRARAWQRYPNGAHLFGPYRAAGDTQTWVIPELRGEVWNAWGEGLPGATVVVSETGQTAVSQAGGVFVLRLNPPLDAASLAVSHPAWAVPPPRHEVSTAPTATLALTWTMRPAGDVVSNGDFEQGLAGWSWTPGSAATLSDTVHTGRGAVALATEPPTATVSLSQTVVLTGAWQPALGFWYRAREAGDEAGGESAFHVVLTVVTETLSATLGAAGPPTATVAVTSTQVLTPPLGVAGRWFYFWSPVGPPDSAVSGRVTVDFRLRGEPGEALPALYLDEVGLGPLPGGPWRLYLPLAVRGP
jgi:hypothetical protein